MDVDNTLWPKIAFSESRLKPYLLAMENDLVGATALYGLNIRVSTELFGWLAVLEVVLRNSLMGTTKQEINRDFDPLYPIWAELSIEGKASYQRTEDRLRKAGKQINLSTLSAELPFSFWKHLLSSRYETSLWTSNFRNAFPYLALQKRSTVFRAVELASELRNRIAHHEPIFRRQLGADLAQIQQVIGWISPEALQWAKVYLPQDVIGVGEGLKSL